MKKLLFAGMLFGGTLGVFAQGQVDFSNDKIGTIISHVYSPDVNTPNVEFQGNGTLAYSSSVRSGDFPVGTVTYTGVLIGGQSTGSGSAGWANGANYSAELYYAVGDNVAAGSLGPLATSLTVFSTSPGTKGTGGWVSEVAPVISNIGQGGSATMQVKAWYSGAGAFPSYESAVSAGMPAGFSSVFNVDNIQAAPNNPGLLPGFTSFSLTANPVPEPSTIALGVMGAFAFLIRRRK